MTSFGHPVMLWALVLAVAPLLLHWLRRPAEPQPVPFSATRFLVKIARQYRRRRRLKQWLRLIVQVLLLLLVVLAFARPLRTDRRARADGRKPTAPLSTDVRIVAEPRDYVDAALGKGMTSETGRRALVFLGDSPSVSAEEIGASLGGIQAGEVTVAAAPYFHPALAVFDQPHVAGLGRVRVRRWWKLLPGSKSWVVARLSNRDPFLIEHWTTDGPVIVCAVAADPSWTDLPFHPAFVPMARELVRYLAEPPLPMPASQRAPLPAPADHSRALLTAALVLALVEIALARSLVFRLPALFLVVLLLAQPIFRWERAQPKSGPVVVLIDQTDSMQFRGTALRSLDKSLPAGERKALTGKHTDLGAPLLALTNQPVSAVVLVGDGQHNRGLSPSLAAAALGIPVLTVAAGDPGSPADVSVSGLEATDLVFPGEEVAIRARIAMTGLPAAACTLRLRQAGTVMLVTNVAPGEITLHFAPTGPGLTRYVLEAESQRSEVTVQNNQRPFSVRVAPRRIRVHVVEDKMDWEYQHVRQALRLDRAVELVAEPQPAEVVITPLDGTWRLRGLGEEVFRRYWRERVRSGWRELDGSGPNATPSEEPYRLWRDDELLQDIARASGGRFFTAETISQLPSALHSAAPRESRRLDLRDSWLVLLVLAGAFIASWLPRRASPGTA